MGPSLSPRCARGEGSEADPGSLPQSGLVYRMKSLLASEWTPSILNWKSATPSPLTSP